MNAAMARISPSSRRKVGILVPSRQACGSFSHTGIHSLCSLHAHFFQAGPDLLDFAHQAAGAVVELLDLGVQQADAHLQVVGVLIKLLRFVVDRECCRPSGGEADFARPFGFLLVELADILVDGG